MEAVSYAEASENLEAMIDKVVADRAPLAITLEQGQGAVLVSANEWASINRLLHSQNAQQAENFHPNSNLK